MLEGHIGVESSLGLFSFGSACRAGCCFMYCQTAFIGELKALVLIGDLGVLIL